MMDIYAKTTNSKKIIILNGDRHSLRCRQRSKLLNGKKVDPMRFVSYKDMNKIRIKDKNKVIGPLVFYSISKL